MLFLLTKRPWEVSLHYPDPVAASLQELAISLTVATQFFVECSVSEALKTVQGKKKTSRKKKKKAFGGFVIVCLFACLPASLHFNADHLANLFHEMIPLAVVMAHLNECGSRQKGLKGSEGRSDTYEANFATKEHVPCN